MNSFFAEYGMGCEVSTNGDVYSYGILLLEMFTGKRPTDEFFKEGLSLHGYVKRALPLHVLEIADPSLLSETPEESSRRRAEKVQECLTSVMQIGIACSTELPRERMAISDAVKKLCFSKDKLTGVGVHGGRRRNANPEQN